MRKNLVLVMLLALPLAATQAFAQGFGVYEHSACAMARGGTGVAAPCEDASSIFFNPAGLASTTGLQISFGGTVINPRGHFHPDANPSSLAALNLKYYPVPSFYLAKQLGKLVVGGGLFAPYGLTTDWPTTFEGRFLGYKTMVKGIYIQPTVAYNVNENFMIGGGVDITYAGLELNQRVDLSSQYALAPGQHPLYPNGLTFAGLGVPKGTDFADVQLKGHTYRAGFHVGMMAKVTPDVSLGARYMSRQGIDVNDGTFGVNRILNPSLRLPVALSPTIPAGTPIDALLNGQFAAGGSLADNQAAKATGLVFPDQLVLGTAFKVARNTTALVDYQFTHWGLFKAITIARTNSTSPTVMQENYKDTHGIRLGVEQALNGHVQLRGGYIHHTAAAPDETVTPLLPEGPRNEFTVGFGAKVAKNLRADFAYQYLMQADRRGRTVAGPNNGEYNFMSHLFGANLAVLF